MTAGPQKPLRRPRRGAIRIRSNAEMVMSSSGLRKRIFLYSSLASLQKIIRVCKLWFDEAVPVLFETVDLIHLVDLMDASSYSGVYLPYFDSVRRIMQKVGIKCTPDGHCAPESHHRGHCPFLPLEIPSLVCAVNFGPTLFPNMHSMLVDLPAGFEWGAGDVRRGGDRAMMSFNKSSGYGDRTIYVERCVGISQYPYTLDAQLQLPTMPGFKTKIAYSILAEGNYTMSGNLTPSLPGAAVVPLRNIKHPVKTLVIKGIDIHVNQIISLLAQPMQHPWPADFDNLDRDLICDRVMGMGLAEFRALAKSPGAKGIPVIRLESARAADDCPHLKPSDIYKIRDILQQELPDVRDLALSLVVDDDYENSYTDQLVDDPPAGQLDLLQVTLHSRQRTASSSRAKKAPESFPLNLIRRLATLVAEGGKLHLQGVDLVELQNRTKAGGSATRQGVDVSDILVWIRRQNKELRPKIWTLDYTALGITRHLQLPLICFDFGAPMPLVHSLAHAFCAELCELAMKQLAILSSSSTADDAVHALCCSRDKMTKSHALLDVRTRAVDLDTLIIESHLLGVREDVHTVGMLAMQLLADLMKVGMKGVRETTDGLMKKYPELFEGVRKMSKQAMTAKAQAVRSRFAKAV